MMQKLEPGTVVKSAKVGHVDRVIVNLHVLFISLYSSTFFDKIVNEIDFILIFQVFFSDSHTLKEVFHVRVHGVHLKVAKYLAKLPKKKKRYATQKSDLQHTPSIRPKRVTSGAAHLCDVTSVWAIQLRRNAAGVARRHFQKQTD